MKKIFISLLQVMVVATVLFVPVNFLSKYERFPIIKITADNGGMKAILYHEWREVK